MARTRAATQNDADGVAAMLNELGYPTARVGRADPYFPSGAQVFRVTALVVAASHRGKGLGRALLEHGIQVAAAHGCTGVELTTGEQRADAHAFYERLGFRRTSLRYVRSLTP